MIDDILEMVLKEARHRHDKDLIINLFAVMRDVETSLINIIADIRQGERRKEEDENKG